MSEHDELREVNAVLRERLAEAEETIHALRSGEADAVFVEDGVEKVYTLESPDRWYRLLVEQMPHAAATVTVEGRIIHCNRRFAAMLDQPPHALCGQPIQDFVCADSRARLEQMLRDCANEELLDEIVLQRNAGETIPIHLGVAPMQDGAFGTCRMLVDQTEQKRYHELQRTQAALREADRRKDEFLATLAHELRNPLAPIRHAVEILKVREIGADSQWSLDVLDRQVRQMSRLLDDLLDVSRISRNTLELRTERVDLRSVLEQALETSRPIIEAGGHHLEISLPPEPLPLDADPVRLGQVFGNLLNNAAKYTEDGGRLWLTVERQGREAMVAVKDSGIGISADMLPRLFQIFSQAEPALVRAQGGLGIGLSLAKGLLELHGGRIEAHSAGLGQGSSFIVHLPLAVTAAPVAPTQASPQDRARPSARMRMLIVDDNRDSADSLAMLLEVMGNEVETAYDGERAIAIAEMRRPDVVLLDLGMPRMNGYEVCRRIRQAEWGQSLCLVALTGWGQEADRHRTQEAGFDHHVVKPVDPAALMKLVGATPKE